MLECRFKVLVMRDSSAEEWLRAWSALYGDESNSDEKEYRDLILEHQVRPTRYYERIGQWKDSATGGRWSPTAESVAYQVWKLAERKRPTCPSDNEVRTFLDFWTKEECHFQRSSRTITKHFGVPRSATLLHFLSGGRWPIYDSRANRGVACLLGQDESEISVENYLNFYCPVFKEIAALCGTEKNRRELDRALLMFGARESYSIPIRMLK